MNDIEKEFLTLSEAEELFNIEEKALKELAFCVPSCYFTSIKNDRLMINTQLFISFLDDIDDITKPLKKKFTGIYRIYNKKNHKSYVGQSRDIYKRLQQHHNDLRKGSHVNKKIQRDYDKIGGDLFVTEILQECSEKELDKYESYYINVFSEFGVYNIVIPPMPESIENKLENPRKPYAKKRTTGHIGVSKRSDNNFLARYTLDSKVYHYYGKTEEEAREKAQAAMNAQLGVHADVVSINITREEYLALKHIIAKYELFSGVA